MTSEVQQLYSVCPGIFGDATLINGYLQDLASQLVDIGAQVATLARDSSNVVDLISNTYNVRIVAAVTAGM